MYRKNGTLISKVTIIKFKNAPAYDFLQGLGPSPFLKSTKFLYTHQNINAFFTDYGMCTLGIIIDSNICFEKKNRVVAAAAGQAAGPKKSDFGP